MMRLKNLKSKILVGLVTFGIMGGVAFATTNAGTQLRNWYSAKNEATKVQVCSNLSTYTDGKKTDLEEEIKRHRIDAKGTLASRTFKEANIVVDKLHAVRDEAIKQLGEESERIQTEMPGDYDQFIGLKNKAVNTGLDQEGADIQEVTNSELLKSMDDGILLIKEIPRIYEKKAVEEIKAAIESSKTSIEEELERQNIRATRALKNNFDTKVDQLRVSMNAETNDLVEFALDKFSKKSNQVEKDTLERLDTLMKSI